MSDNGDVKNVLGGKEMRMGIGMYLGGKGWENGHESIKGMKF